MEAIRSTDDGSARIAAHDVRSTGYDVAREEINEKQRVREELIRESKAQRSAAAAARGGQQELGGAAVRDHPARLPLGGGEVAPPQTTARTAVHHEADPTVHDGGGDDAMDGGQGDIVDGAFDMDMGFIGSLQPSVDDCVAELLLAQLGAGRRHIREHRQAARKLISEIYSPPRITKEIVRGGWKHVAPGFALDLTVNDPYDNRPWDFSRADKRRRALELLREQKPYLLIGSPECKAFCTWMALNRARAWTPRPSTGA